MRLNTQTPQTTSESSAGFTLVEIIVAVVILLVITAIITTTLINGLNSHVKAQNTNRAVSDVQNGMRSLQADLKGAYSSDRNADEVADLDVLRRGVLDGKTIKATGKSRNLDVRDVLIANGTTFEFRADSDNDGTTDCVKYQAVASGTPGLYKLVRTVYVNTWPKSPSGPLKATCEGALKSGPETILSNIKRQEP